MRQNFIDYVGRLCLRLCYLLDVKSLLFYIIFQLFPLSIETKIMLIRISLFL